MNFLAQHHGRWQPAIQLGDPYVSWSAERSNRRIHAISAAATVAIQNRDYKGLRSALRETNASQVCVYDRGRDHENEKSNFSGLELSAYTGDWKMLLVFIFGGADPNTHWFRGICANGSADYRFPSVHAARVAPTSDNSGFSRLRLILHDTRVHYGGETDTLKVEAALWLLERLHAGTIEINGATSTAAQLKIRLLNPHFDWVTGFSDPAVKLMASVRALGDSLESGKELPHAIIRQLADQPIQDLLLRAIRTSLEELVVDITSKELVAEETDCTRKRGAALRGCAIGMVLLAGVYAVSRVSHRH